MFVDLKDIEVFLHQIYYLTDQYFDLVFSVFAFVTFKITLSTSLLKNAAESSMIFLWFNI